MISPDLCVTDGTIDVLGLFQHSSAAQAMAYNLVDYDLSIPTSFLVRSEDQVTPDLHLHASWST